MALVKLAESLAEQIREDTRARQDIKSQSRSPPIRKRKRTKQTTSKSSASKTKRQKTRDVFD